MNKNVSFSDLLLDSLQEKCLKHDKKYQYIIYSLNKQFEFLCEECSGQENCIKLDIKNVIQQPILFTILANNQPNKQLSYFIKTFINLNINSENGKYSSTQTQYKLLQKFFQIWQLQFKQLCNHILQQYKQHLTENSNNSLQKITQTSKNYRQQFQQLFLESNQPTTIRHLSNIISNFVQKNKKYDPLPIIKENLENFREEINCRKKVNWNYITNLYKEVMGHQKWRTQNILKPLLEKPEYIHEVSLKYAMPDDMFQLTQPNRTLCYDSTSNQLFLYKTNATVSEVKIFDISQFSGISYRSAQNGLQPLSKLELKISIDYIQQINSYMLLGINYNQIILICYCFDKLQIIGKISISGVVQIHNYKQNLYIVSNGKLLKLNLQDFSQKKQQNYEVLSLDCIKIKILQKSQTQFLQLTSQDGTMKRIVCK